MFHVVQVEAVDPDVLHLLQPHPGVEGDRRQDGDLRRGVAARHVLRRVGLRVAQGLRRLQRLGVGGAVTDHPGQDVVGRAVDDPVDAVDAGHDHRLAEHLDHRDGGAHAGLEAQLDTAALGLGEQLLAVPGEQLLVGGDDRLSRPQELEHVAARRLDPAHHLGHDRDRRVVTDAREVGGEQAGWALGAPGRVADEGCRHLHRLAGHPLDGAGALVEQAVHGGAHRAVSEKSDGDRGHGRMTLSNRPCRPAGRAASWGGTR